MPVLRNRDLPVLHSSYGMALAYDAPGVTRPAVGSMAPLGSTLATGLACYRSRA